MKVHTNLAEDAEAQSSTRNLFFGNPNKLKKSVPWMHLLQKEAKNWHFAANPASAPKPISQQEFMSKLFQFPSVGIYYTKPANGSPFYSALAPSGGNLLFTAPPVA